MDQQPPISPSVPVVPPGVEYQIQGVPPKKKSRLWLWITLAVTGVLLVIGVVLFIFAYPGIQARAVATAFMDAVKDNNESKMKDLSGTGSDGVTTKANAGLKGASYKIKDVTSKDMGYVVNFEVSDSSTLTGTTIVVKSGKVTTFNISSKDTASAPTASSGGSSASSCLTLTDLQNSGITYIDQTALDSTKNSNDGNGIYFDETFFKPDSTDYLSEMGSKAVVDKMMKLYNDNKSKTFFFMIRGSVRQDVSTDAGTQLANQRADKVKADLIALGMPVERIKMYNPIAISSSYADADRRVEINLNPYCAS